MTLINTAFRPNYQVRKNIAFSSNEPNGSEIATNMTPDTEQPKIENPFRVKKLKEAFKIKDILIGLGDDGVKIVKAIMINSKKAKEIDLSKLKLKPIQKEKLEKALINISELTENRRKALQQWLIYPQIPEELQTEKEYKKIYPIKQDEHELNCLIIAIFSQTNSLTFLNKFRV